MIIIFVFSFVFSLSLLHRKMELGFRIQFCPSLRVFQKKKNPESLVPAPLLHSPRKKSRRWKQLLAALPDNVDLLGKVRARLEERLQHARKEARDSKPLDQRLEGCRGALQRASKVKQAAIAQQQAAQAAFEKKPCGRVQYSSRTCRTRNRHFRKSPSGHVFRLSLAKQLH